MRKGELLKVSALRRSPSEVGDYLKRASSKLLLEAQRMRYSSLS